jgi:hypothetical protein
MRTFSWSHHTTTASMPRNMPLPRLKNILLLPLLLLTCFPPYSFGTNFYHKLNLHSTFDGSPIATHVFQPTRNFTVHSISTKRHLPLLGQKHWFTTILQQEPPACRIQLTVSTLARPTTTTVVFASTSHQLSVSALQTHGSFTLPIAKSLLHLNKTKSYSQRPTYSN